MNSATKRYLKESIYVAFWHTTNCNQQYILVQTIVILLHNLVLETTFATHININGDHGEQAECLLTGVVSNFH